MQPKAPENEANIVEVNGLHVIAEERKAELQKIEKYVRTCQNSYE